MPRTLQICLGGRDLCDPEELWQVRGRLRHTLETLGAEVALSADEPPSGAKGTGIDVASLIISFTGGMPGIVDVVRAVKAWLVRDEAGSITLDIDGDRIEITKVSNADRDVLIRAWLSRHSDK